MKRRLHDTASRRMERLVCCQEPVAEEPLRAVKAATFHEPVVMRQEYVFNGGRVIEEKREARAQSKGHDIIRILGQLLQEGERVGLPTTERPEGAGWIRW